MTPKVLSTPHGPRENARFCGHFSPLCGPPVRTAAPTGAFLPELPPPSRGLLPRTWRGNTPTPRTPGPSSLETETSLRGRKRQHRCFQNGAPLVSARRVEEGGLCSDRGPENTTLISQRWDLDTSPSLRVPQVPSDAVMRLRELSAASAQKDTISVTTDAV